MKIRTGFYVWALMLVALFVLQHTRLRAFPHILLLFWLLLPLASLANVLLARKNALVSMKSTHAYEREQPFPIRLQVKNRGAFTVLRLWLHTPGKGEPLLVSPKEETAFTLYTEATHIGAYPLPDRNVYIDEPFGLFRLPVNIQPDRVWILPGEIDTTTTAIEGQSGQSPRTTPFQNGQGETAFVEPLPYGKPMRHIHWKMSARMQEWMTKHMDEEADPTRLFILLPPPGDTEENRNAKDDLYDTAYTRAKLALKRKQPVRLFAKEPLNRLYAMPEQSRSLRLALSMHAAEEPQPLQALRQIDEKTQSVLVFAHRIDNATENELLSLRGRVHKLEVLLFTDAGEDRLNRLRDAQITITKVGDPQ